MSKVFDFIESKWIEFIILVLTVGSVAGGILLFINRADFPIATSNNPGTYTLVATWTLCYALLDYKATVSAVRWDTRKGELSSADQPLIDSRRTTAYWNLAFRIVGVSAALFAGLYIWHAQAKNIQETKKFEEVSIKAFLDDRVMTDVLSRARKNVYIVSLADVYVRNSHSKDIAEATVNGKQVVSMIYLPVEKDEAAINGYVGYFRLYQPNGNRVMSVLKPMWGTETVGPPYTGTTTTPVPERYHLRFYSDPPRGWGIFIDVSDDMTTAKEIYWFPYFNASRNQDRPGLHFAAPSKLADEIMLWLKSVYDTKSRPADAETIAFWNQKIQALPDDDK